MDTFIEYRVRPVTRYIVTRFERQENSEGDVVAAGSSVCGEYDAHQQAYDVGYALAKADHGRLGYPPDDGRIKYPEHPQAVSRRLEAGYVPRTPVEHASDCAVHNEPALPAGECDCGGGE